MDFTFMYDDMILCFFTNTILNFKWSYALQHDGCGSEDSLDVENTLWANCVVASGSALGVVVYTGSETRSVMNNSQPRSKVGLLDMEINQLTKVWRCTYINMYK
jgi:phospholipid-translocating ATPase